MEKYKIDSLGALFGRFKIENAYGLWKDLKNFFQVAESSSMISRPNCFFQWMNFVLGSTLLFYSIPALLDSLLPFFDFKIFLIPIGRLLFTIGDFVLLWFVGIVFEWSPSSIFETAPKVTIFISSVLIAVALFIYNKLFAMLYKKVKNVVEYWIVNTICKWETN